MIVAFDTSARAGSIAVGRCAGQMTLRSLDTRTNHSAALVPVIEEMIAAYAPDDEPLESVVVGLGPGSFTGVRIGVAAALGIRAAERCALYAISSFDPVALAVARGARPEGVALGEGDRIAVVAHARVDSLYTRTFAIDASGSVRPDGPCCVLPADRVTTADPAVIVSPDRDRVFEKLGGRVPLPDRWVQRSVPPRADLLAELALATTDPLPAGAVPKPIYLHPPAKEPAPEPRLPWKDAGA